MGVAFLVIGFVLLLLGAVGWFYNNIPESARAKERRIRQALEKESTKTHVLNTKHGDFLVSYRFVYEGAGWEDRWPPTAQLLQRIKAILDAHPEINLKDFEKDWGIEFLRIIPPNTFPTSSARSEIIQAIQQKLAHVRDLRAFYSEMKKEYGEDKDFWPAVDSIIRAEAEKQKLTPFLGEETTEPPAS